MPRLATLISVFVLALPGAAFAQGAGDDQYQDPFGDEPAQQDDSGGGDGGLSDEPSVPGDGGGSGSSGGGSGSSGSGSSGSGSSGSGSGSAGTSGSTAPAPTTGTAGTASATPAAGGDQLPNTGSDPRLLLLLGAAFVLTGAGLRLRTIDPDAF